MKKIFIIAAAGYFAVILMGLLIHRFEIFNIHNPAFLIAELGFFGAILFPVIYYRENREIILVVISLFLIHFILIKPYRFSFIIRDIVVLSSLITSVYLYARYVVPNLKKKFQLGKVVLLSLIYGIINIAACLILILLQFVLFDYSPENVGGLIFFYFSFGLIIGGGLAIGFNFAEFIINTKLKDL